MIVDIFSAALAFFCEKIDKFLGILTTDITTYQGGAIWKAVSTVYDAMLAIGLTIAGVLIWIQLLSSMNKYAEFRKSTVWIQFIVEIVAANAILYYGKYILLQCIVIGQGIAKRMMNVTGMVSADGTSIFHIVVPEQLGNAIDNMSLLKEIGVFIVVIIASIWIVISTCGVLLSVYGRLFNLYLLIAISPLPIAAAMSKPTRFVTYNFFKSFLAVTLEALVMVLTLYLFQAFFSSGFNLKIAREDVLLTDSYFVTHMADEIGLQTASASKAVFGYIAEISFLFLMLFGMLKGTDKLVNRIFGI